MKLLFNEKIYSWRMTGLLGKDGRWFIGYSCIDSLDDLEDDLKEETPVDKGYNEYRLV